jgi:hypothetical protein
MKKQISFGILLLGAYGALAQGTVRNVNNVTGFLQAKVYGPDPRNPLIRKSGNAIDGCLLVERFMEPLR